MNNDLTKYLIEIDSEKHTVKLMDTGGSMYVLEINTFLKLLRSGEVAVKNCDASNNSFQTTIGKNEDYELHNKETIILLIECIKDFDDIKRENIKFKYITSSGDIMTEDIDKLLSLGSNYRIINKDCIYSQDNIGITYATTYEKCCKSVAYKLKWLAVEIKTNDYLRNNVIKYNNIRNIVIKAANAGFMAGDKGNKSGYRPNQGLYKHKDYSTTLIDLEGFYTDKENALYTSDIAESIGCLSEHINKYLDNEVLAIPDIMSVDNMRKLEKCNGMQLMSQNIIPLNILCKSDNTEVKYKTLSICKGLILKPIYLDELEYDYTINRIYHEVFTKAKACVTY